jgi:hypothetical protein
VVRRARRGCGRRNRRSARSARAHQGPFTAIASSWTRNTCGVLTATLAFGPAAPAAEGEPTNRRTDEPTNRRTDEPTNRRTDEPTNRRTDEPTNRRTLRRLLLRGRAALRPSAHALVPNAAASGRLAPLPRRRAPGETPCARMGVRHGSCADRSRRALPRRGGRRQRAFPPERNAEETSSLLMLSLDLVPCPAPGGRCRRQPGGVEIVVVACDRRGAARSRRAPLLTIVSDSVVDRHVDRPWRVRRSPALAQRRGLRLRPHGSCLRPIVATGVSSEAFDLVVAACHRAARSRRAPPLTLVSGAVLVRHVDRWVHRSRSGKAWRRFPSARAAPWPAHAPARFVFAPDRRHRRQLGGVRPRRRGM